MDKKKVIAIFGSNTKTAKAIGITRSAVSQWPNDLPQIHTDRVVGAAVRLNVAVPSDVLEKAPSAANG